MFCQHLSRVFKTFSHSCWLWATHTYKLAHTITLLLNILRIVYKLCAYWVLANPLGFIGLWCLVCEQFSSFFSSSPPFSISRFPISHTTSICTSPQTTFVWNSLEFFFTYSGTFSLCSVEFSFQFHYICPCWLCLLLFLIFFFFVWCVYHIVVVVVCGWDLYINIWG